jgi:hypothetical protein
MRWSMVRIDHVVALECKMTKLSLLVPFHVCECAVLFFAIGVLNIASLTATHPLRFEVLMPMHYPTRERRRKFQLDLHILIDVVRLDPSSVTVFVH